MWFRFAVLVAFAAVAVAFPQQNGRIKCGYSTCGMNANCTKVNGYDSCICKPDFYGSGYGEGCTSEPQCRNDAACKDEEFCDKNNLCASSCQFKCPADVGCIARNHGVECIFDGQLFFDPHAPINGTSSDGPPRDAVPSTDSKPCGTAGASTQTEKAP